MSCTRGSCSRASRSRCASTCCRRTPTPSTAARRSRSSATTESTPCSSAKAPTPSATQLQALVSAVQAACAAHGVTFLGTDVDRDGGKILLVAGAPTAAGEDEQRLLLAACEVRDAAGALPVQIGVYERAPVRRRGRAAVPAHLHRHGRHGQPRRPGDGARRAGPGAGLRRGARRCRHRVRLEPRAAVHGEGQALRGRRVGRARPARAASAPPRPTCPWSAASSSSRRCATRWRSCTRAGAGWSR